MKLLSPLIYAVSILPAAFLIFLAVRATDYYFGLPKPVVVVAPILLVGGVLFGCLGWVLLRLERLRHPGVVDHARHCAVPYAFLVPVGALLAFSPGLPSGPGGAVVFVVFVSAGYAVLADALVLVWQRRRSDHAIEGDAA